MTSTTGKYWVSRPDQEIDVTLHMKSTGFASKRPITIINALMKTVELNGKRNAMATKLIINVRSSRLLYCITYYKLSFGMYDIQYSNMSYVMSFIYICLLY